MKSYPRRYQEGGSILLTCDDPLGEKVSSLQTQIFGLIRTFALRAGFEKDQINVRVLECSKGTGMRGIKIVKANGVVVGDLLLGEQYQLEINFTISGKTSEQIHRYLLRINKNRRVFTEAELHEVNHEYHSNPDLIGKYGVGKLMMNRGNPRARARSRRKSKRRTQQIR